MPRTRDLRVIAATMAAALAACGDSPVDSTPEPEPCTLAALGSAPAAPRLEPARLEVALADAADRLVRSLGTSPETTALEHALSALYASLRQGEAEASCTAFNGAVEALATWSARHQADSPGRPDFALIRQTLGVVERALR